MKTRIYYSALLLLSGLHMYGQNPASPKEAKEHSEVAVNKLEKDRVVLTEEDIHDLAQKDSLPLIMQVI